MPQVLTLFTDASWCPQSKIGTWAAWAKFRAEDSTMRESGRFRDPLSGAAAAEIRALANGLKCAIKTFNPQPLTSLVVATDCQEVIRVLEGDLDRHSDVEQYINNLLVERGLILDLRHVKGHRGNKTPRNAVNTWCNDEAKRLLNLWRQELQIPLQSAEVIPLPRRVG